MKKITLFLLLSMVTVLSAEAHKYNRNRRAQVTISIQTFYDELSPYGDWVYTPDYGYVWRPYFDYPDAFRPYSSNGHWVNTDFGWTWVSDYRWGWATFHYGRWAFDDYLGWMWVPGYEWAPAWVTWGYYGDYYGWAPMGPAIYAYSSSNWYAPDAWWTFVPGRHFCSGNWNNYIYERPVHVTNITHITNVYVNNNNTKHSWYYGPRVSDVEKYSNNKVRRMEVVDSQRSDNTGVRNDRLSVYRPTVDNRKTDYRPAEYRNAEQIRSERRVQPTSARTNDPGMNRSRDTRTEGRNTVVKPETRTNSTTRDTRVEPRTTRTNESRTNEVRKNQESTPRTAPTGRGTQSSGTLNRETKSANTSQSTEKARVENRTVRNTPSSVERQTNITKPAGTEKIEREQNRNSAPVRENVKPTPVRETEKRQNSSVAPVREQKTQNTSIQSRSSSVNTERNETGRGVVKQTETKRGTTPSTERNPSAKPARR